MAANSLTKRLVQLLRIVRDINKSYVVLLLFTIEISRIVLLGMLKITILRCVVVVYHRNISDCGFKHA